MNTYNQKFSGWSVAAGCFMLMFFVVAIVANTAALFMAPICKQFGFDIAAYSFINLIASLAGAFSAMALAPKMQKGNMKRIMLVCGFITAGAYAAMGLSTRLWQFFALAGIYNVGIAGLSQLTVSMLITAWFEDKRSIVMSVAFAGVGLGASVWSKIFGNLMAKEGGWVTCYFLGGAIILAVSVLVSLFLVKQSPQQYGQKPYTSAKKEASEKQQGSGQKDLWPGLAKKEAIRTFPFAMLVLAMFFLGCLAAGVSTHTINYLLEIHWEMSEAANVLSVFSLVIVVGMLAGGVMFEKLGPVRAIFLATVFAVLGLGSLVLAENHLFGYLYAVFFALAMMMPKLLPALLTSTVFGVRDYGPIYSIFNLVFLVGCALGSVITGISYKLMGYGATWMLYIAFSVLLFFCSAAAIRGGKKLREGDFGKITEEAPSVA